NRGESRLVDVCFALQVQTTATDIADAHDGFPGELALDCEIPAPGFGISEVLGLGRDDERNGGGAGCSWVIRRTVAYARVWLEGRIPPEEDGVAYTEPGDKAAGTGANDRFRSELIGDASAGLDVVVLDVGIMVGNVAEQTIKGA